MKLQEGFDFPSRLVFEEFVSTELDEVSPSSGYMVSQTETNSCIKTFLFFKKIILELTQQLVF